MTWTTTKPTQPGWYWYRHSPELWSPGTILRVGGDGFIFGVQGMPHVSTLTGEWSSTPIPMPKEVIPWDDEDEALAQSY